MSDYISMPVFSSCVLKLSTCIELEIVDENATNQVCFLAQTVQFAWSSQGNIEPCANPIPLLEVGIITMLQR